MKFNTRKAGVNNNNAPHKPHTRNTVKEIRSDYF